MTALYFIGGSPLRCPDLEALWNDPAARERDACLRAANLARHSAAMSDHDARVRRQMLGEA